MKLIYGCCVLFYSYTHSVRLIPIRMCLFVFVYAHSIVWIAAVAATAVVAMVTINSTEAIQGFVYVYCIHWYVCVYWWMKPTCIVYPLQIHSTLKTFRLQYWSKILGHFLIAPVIQLSLMLLVKWIWNYATRISLGSWCHCHNFNKHTHTLTYTKKSYFMNMNESNRTKPNTQQTFSILWFVL